MGTHSCHPKCSLNAPTSTRCQVVRRPSAQAMAALLGLALGVMACVSIVELVLRNAMSGERGEAWLRG